MGCEDIKAFFNTLSRNESGFEPALLFFGEAGKVAGEAYRWEPHESAFYKA